ncbi:transposase family protein [Paucibacter sp. B2R-40]|uniref:transposase family protein n=1 Tax=Paucibacter sp. B2R-40 TaxID=2893554 RepID=UPI0021E4B9B2|nr:transposase family protein [Paucibacter sp. B2R-40]MCV2353161.1 transposase family protein [Paucibacter sp. B2R-40]
MKGAVELQVGSVVSWKGENWIILEPDRHARVLARRLGDDYREFLPINELASALTPDSGADEEASPNDAGTSGLTPDGALPAAPELDDRTGRWKRHLAGRSIRLLPSERHQTDEQKKEIEKATKHFQDVCAILQLSKGSSDRAEATIKLANAHGYSVATAYRYVAIAEETGTADALQRAHRSDRGNIRLNKEQWKIINKNLDEYRFIPEYQSIESVLVFVNGDLREAKLKPISLRTLYNAERRVKTRQQKLIAQGRKEQARNEFGSRAGKLPDADFPLAIVQIDHTTVQIIFVDEDQRKPLTDAWLTLVIDCFSRMVMGYYLTFEEPTAMAAGIALARSFLPKDEHLKRMSVTGNWPCWGYPTVIIADNAADLNGYLMRSASRHMRFDIRNRPVDRPNFGGHIESAFRTFMIQQRSVKGTKFSNPVERAEYDSKANSGITLTEFDELFTEFLVNDYHLKEHEGDGMKRRCPLQRWEAGIFDGDVFPPTGLPDIPEDPEHVYIVMLPFEYRVVQNLIVEIFGERYYSKELSKLSHRADRSLPLEERKHEIRYDPRNIACIWVRDPTTGKYIRAQVQNVHWSFRSLWECNEIRRRWGKPAKVHEQARYESKKRQEEIKRTAEGKTQEAKKARRKTEQGRRNLKEALVGSRAEEPSKESTNPLLKKRPVITPGDSKVVAQPKFRVPKMESKK